MRLGRIACFNICVVAGLAYGSLAVAQTPWPDFQAGLKPDVSSSTAKAELPGNVKIEAAAPGTPADRARLLGQWKGWMCRDAIGDTKVAFEKIDGDDVTVVYAYANTTFNQAPSVTQVQAKFVGNEIRGTLKSGAQLTYRLRSDGYLDVIFQASNGKNWCSGLLTEASATVVATGTLTEKTVCGVKVALRFAGTDPREGVYEGSWRSLQYGSEMCAAYAIEKVNDDGTASTVYIYGSNPTWGVNQSGYRRGTTSFKDDTITNANPKIVVKFKGNQATGIFRDDSTPGTFVKQ